MDEESSLLLTMNASVPPTGVPARAGDDLGRRVELVSMDRYMEDISVGLYVRDGETGPVATVHSYSRREGVPERLEYIAHALSELGGMRRLDDPVTVAFPCGTWHATAARRLFLDACKHDPSTPLEPRPLEAPDTRTDQTILVEPLGGGAYEVQARGVTGDEQSRAPAIARGIAKLAELERDEGERSIVRFECGSDHHELIGLLLGRAQNLRAVLREEESQAGRGVLAAPSAQE
jgi:hypothetical protein